jgi:hypothetical protein
MPADLLSEVLISKEPTASFDVAQIAMDATPLYL